MVLPLHNCLVRSKLEMVCERKLDILKTEKKAKNIMLEKHS